MTGLPDHFLQYPHRRRGPDHTRYEAGNYRQRAPIVLEGAGRLGVWIVVLLESFPLDPRGTPFRASGSMQTPYPDLRHYTARDYGNRVGVYRILTALATARAQATFAVQGMVARRYPALLRDIVADGHEICAHGWDADTLHHAGLAPEEERGIIDRTLAELGQVAGWISPARCESPATPDLLAQAGLSWFADWAHDALPVPFHTSHGDLMALPLSNELDDWQIIAEYRRPEAEWVQQIGDAAHALRAEADRFGPQILSMTVRPYIFGQPYRIGAFAEGLRAALSASDARCVTAAHLIK